MSKLLRIDSLRKSFKSNASSFNSDLEHQPILPSGGEVVVSVDKGHEEHNSTVGIVDDPDPPSRLISSFITKQKASGEKYLDVDLDLDELKPSPSAAAAREVRVSFRNPPNETSSDLTHRPWGIPPRPGSNHHHSGSDVIRCTSYSYARGSTLMRNKTKSRLTDQAPLRAEVDRRPTMARSGMLGKTGQINNNHDDDDVDVDDDPFTSEDVPEDFNRRRLGLLVVVEWVSLVILLVALGCSLWIPTLQRVTAWNLQLWKWEVFILALICGRLVSGWGVRIAVFFIERNFLLRKRVLYFVYGVRKAVQNCLWLGLVLLAWHYIFDPSMLKRANTQVLQYVTKVLVCLLIATLLRLLKILLVKVLASSFHVTTYFDRIQESLFNQYVIETLSGPPLVELQNAREEEERMLAEVEKLQNAGAALPPDLRATIMPPRAIGESRRAVERSMPVRKSVRFSGPVVKRDCGKAEEGMITIEHLHKLNQKNVSAWNMKRLMKIVRYGSLSTLDERLGDLSGEDESAIMIRSEYEAKKAAKKIFINVARPDAKYIYMVDLMHFMREDEAIKAMSLFDGAQETKKVSKSSLKNWVVNAFRERRALSLTLNDTKTAVKKLHQMANVAVGVIIFVIWLLILGIATTRILVLMSSQFLLAAFIFGNTCKTTFEAIVFLFVMHPFDVGDRCEIEGVHMIVEEMNILTTVFLRYDGLKIAYPNNVLSGKPIANFYRSPDMGDAIDFCIHVSTPVEKVATIKEKIKVFIESKKEYWYPSPMVVLRDVEEMNKLKISVWFQHRMNHQDMGTRFERREQVVQEMIRCFRELDIEYRMLPLDINLRKMPPLLSSRLPSTWTNCG